MTDTSTGRRGRAVVLGAGLAGIMAARVLAETHREVTVIDRDDLSGTGQRRGVPQGRHPHVLVDAGRRIFERLFPGITDELHGRGAPTAEPLVETVSYLAGLSVHPTPTDMTWVMASRPLLETVLRARLVHRHGVRFRSRLGAAGLVGEDGRVVGVRVTPTDGGETGVVAADLVVDATGRASRAPDWLAELGLDRPVEERIDVDLCGVSRTYRRLPEHADGKLAVNMSVLAGQRGGYALGIEDDRWHVMVAGSLGDRPPHDDAGFRAFAATLPVPEFTKIVADAEPLDDPVPYRFRGSLRRRYDRLRTPPDGFVVLGDAMCSFNPVYGHGMTVAAQEALLLGECLGVDAPGLAARFYRRAAKPLEAAWQLSTSGDLNHPDVAGRPTPRARLLAGYNRRVLFAAHSEPVVGRAFFRVFNLVDPAASLLKPATVTRVLRAGRPPARPVRAAGRAAG